MEGKQGDKFEVVQVAEGLMTDRIRQLIKL
jgi:hypothetical protein